MLVLSRKMNETIVIPGVGEIKVVEIRRKSVRLGLEFPPDVIIRRGELPSPDDEQDPSADQASPVTI